MNTVTAVFCIALFFAIAAGVAALVFDLPPPRVRRFAKLFALASAGGAFTACLGLLLYHLGLSPSLVAEFGGVGWCILAISCIAVITACFWLAFYHVLKKGVAA